MISSDIAVNMLTIMLYHYKKKNPEDTRDDKTILTSLVDVMYKKGLVGFDPEDGKYILPSAIKELSDDIKAIVKVEEKK